MQTSDIPEAGPSQGRYQPYASPDHQVSRGRYITSNDPRGFIPVFEYPLNGQWIMMDADDGYILWTGIWKALGNSKADIVRMLEARPDWTPQVRRVRGGYLKIQGTWLPYETALMLSRRVGYPIRNDLIPLFGPSFPDTCLTPGQVGYGQVLPTITVRRRRRPVQPAPAPTPPSPPQPQGSPENMPRPYSESPVESRNYEYSAAPSSYPPPSTLAAFGAPQSSSSRFTPYPSSSSPSTPWSPARHVRTPSSSTPATVSAPPLHPSSSFDIANGGLRLPPITAGSAATYAEPGMEDARDVLRRLSEPDEY